MRGGARLFSPPSSLTPCGRRRDRTERVADSSPTCCSQHSSTAFNQRNPPGRSPTPTRQLSRSRCEVTSPVPFPLQLSCLPSGPGRSFKLWLHACWAPFDSMAGSVVRGAPAVPVLLRASATAAGLRQCINVLRSLTEANQPLTEQFPAARTLLAPWTVLPQATPTTLPQGEVKQGSSHDSPLPPTGRNTALHYRLVNPAIPAGAHSLQEASSSMPAKPVAPQQRLITSP